MSIRTEFSVAQACLFYTTYAGDVGSKWLFWNYSQTSVAIPPQAVNSQFMITTCFPFQTIYSGHDLSHPGPHFGSQECFTLPPSAHQLRNCESLMHLRDRLLHIQLDGVHFVERHGEHVVDASGPLPGLLLEQLGHERASDCGSVVDLLQSLLLERICPLR